MHKSPNINILSEDIKPIGRNYSNTRTFADMQNERKQERLPHHSFDLNGDGIVSKN